MFAVADKIDFQIIGSSEEVPGGEAVLVKESSGFTSFSPWSRACCGPAAT
jgi:sulfonate transport system substrate-binding protein